VLLFVEDEGWAGERVRGFFFSLYSILRLTCHPQRKLPHQPPRHRRTQHRRAHYRRLPIHAPPVRLPGREFDIRGDVFHVE
jgi:hypothetical protein